MKVMELNQEYFSADCFSYSIYYHTGCFLILKIPHNVVECGFNDAFIVCVYKGHVN